MLQEETIMVRPVNRKKEKTKALVLNSATQLFIKNGYKNTRIRDIAVESNVGYTEIFRMFNDKDSLLSQLKEKNEEFKIDMPYHQDIINDRLPLTIGGGIGQSRLCMLLLGRAHIGEVQASYWDEETLKECEKQGIELL